MTNTNDEPRQLGVRVRPSVSNRFDVLVALRRREVGQATKSKLLEQAMEEFCDREERRLAAGSLGHRAPRHRRSCEAGTAAV